MIEILDAGPKRNVGDYRGAGSKGTDIAYNGQNIRTSRIWSQTLLGQKIAVYLLDR